MKKRRWTAGDIDDQTGRVAIVTGGNSGIGFETVKALAERGAHVVIGSRSLDRARAALDRLGSAAGTTSVLQLDLADLDSVRRFTAEFLERHHRLDLLINNAGVMNPPGRQETKDGFELQIGTNHLGHFALYLGLAETIEATQGSRVVTVSSTAQNFGRFDLDDLHWTRRAYRGMQAYGASKIANMLFTLELKRRLEAAGSSTIATAAHPGWTATNLQATTLAFRMLNPIFAMQPWQGALPTLFAAVAREATNGGYYGPDGLGSMRGYPVPNEPAEVSRDADLARRFWTASEELVA